jgi:fatty-acyl-CoA synthase
LSDFLTDITARRALLAPHKTAFIDLSSGTTLSYTQLEERVCRAAGLLADRGVGAGDRVALLCRNRIEFFELLFACAKLGAVLAPLNWRMPAAELSPLLADARPKLLFYGHEDAGVARALACAGMSQVALDGQLAGAYASLRNGSDALAGRSLWPADECWYLLYTSGTTGKPKAVIQTYRMAVANYVNIRQGMAIGADDTTLNYLPLFHTAGINLVTLPTLMEGGKVLVAHDFDPECIMDLFRKGALDTFFAVPAVYQQLSLQPGFESLDLSRIRNWGCGGAPMPDELLRRYIARGARVCNGMGMTETGPTVFLMDAGNVSKKIGSVGKPQLLAAVRIVDSQGQDVPPGESGELWFAGPNITPGYWHNEQASRAAFSPDGWLKSGDMARCDEDGYYYIVGRIKDMYISGGENVYPAEVENVLADHPAILEAAVLGVPDLRWGEVGRAFVLLRPGHALPPEADLVRYCRERLAPYKVPKSFVEVSDFPRTAAGKIQKHLIGEGH